MKCPCCDNQLPVDILAFNNRIYFGRKEYKLSPSSVALFNRLLQGPLAVMDVSATSFKENLKNLRAALRDIRAPYKVKTHHRGKHDRPILYTLERLLHAQASNRPSQHPQDVHSGPRLHNLRR